MKKCEHTDGWIIKDELVVDEGSYNDHDLVDVVCNHLGCKVKRKIKIYEIDCSFIEEE